MVSSLCDGRHSAEDALSMTLMLQEAPMKPIKTLLGTLILFLLAGAPTLVSQNNHLQPQASYTYDQANQQTVSGWVVETRDFQCPVSGTMGSHITVKSGTATIEVHLAPASFMKQYEIAIRKNDNVTVVGSRIMFDGKPALIAKAVIVGRDTFNFRDPNGRPLW
jgi:hypothetical protein